MDPELAHWAAYLLDNLPQPGAREVHFDPHAGVVTVADEWTRAADAMLEDDEPESS